MPGSSCNDPHRPRHDGRFSSPAARTSNRTIAPTSGTPQGPTPETSRRWQSDPNDLILGRSGKEGDAPQAAAAIDRVLDGRAKPLGNIGQHVGTCRGGRGTRSAKSMTDVLPEGVTVDRRRAGRPKEVSPELLPLMRGAADPPVTRQVHTRYQRPALIAFVTDAASERAVCDGLADVVPGGVDVRRGGIACGDRIHAEGDDPERTGCGHQRRRSTADRARRSWRMWSSRMSACCSSAKWTASISIVRSRASWAPRITCRSR